MHSQRTQKLVTNHVLLLMYHLIIREQISCSCKLAIMMEHAEISVDKFGKQYTIRLISLHFSFIEKNGIKVIFLFTMH